MQPKMFLCALDELFHVFKGVGVNDTDGQCIVAHKILSLASLHCTEWQGKPIDPHKTMGTVSSLVDVHDEKGLERLTWAVYDGVLLPGDLLELHGQHNWVQIIMGTYRLVYRGNRDSEHCPLCTSMSFDAIQAAKRAVLQHRHTSLLRATPPPGTPRIPALQSTYSAKGSMAASLDHRGYEEEDGPFHQFDTHRVELGSLGRKQKHPCIRWYIAPLPRTVKLTPCGEPPSG